MKVSHIALALIALSTAPSAFASTLQLENSAKQIDGVTISKGGKMTVEGRNAVPMITIAAGERVAFFGQVKAYVGELLVDDNKKFVCDKAKALDSVANLNGIAMHITVMSGLFTKDKLVEAFNGGFKANGITDLSKVNGLSKFVDSLNAGAAPAKKAQINFTGEKLSDGSEVVTYDDGKTTPASIHGGPGLIRAVFGLWLGKTTDSDLQPLIDTLSTCQMQ